MALGFRGGLLTGVALAAAAACALPRWGRPAAKAALKGGLAAYEGAAEAAARLREALEDVAAEAAFERAAERAAASEAQEAVPATPDGGAPRETFGTPPAT
jgi:hypothetical protein